MRYCCGSIDLRGEHFLPREQHEIRYNIEEFFRGRVKLEENFNACTLDIIIDDRDWPHPISNGDYSLIVLNRANNSIVVRLRSPVNYRENDRYSGQTKPTPPRPLTWELSTEKLSEASKATSPKVPATPTRSKKLLLL